MKISWIITLLLSFNFLGCGSFEESEGEDYGNILNTAQGLVLTEGEHAIGWREPNCFICHQADNIHRLNRTGLNSVDVKEIQQTVLDEGLTSCSRCHGTNGVP